MSLITPLFAAPLTAHPACADADRPMLPRGTYGLAWDNDIFLETDRYYSSGLRLEWTSPRLEQDDLSGASGCYFRWVNWVNRKLDRALGGAEAVGRNMKVTFLGYEIYTPTDPNRTDLLVDDHPYAGWGYVGYGYNVRKHGTTRARMDSIEARLGVVGPSARAEELTRQLHGSTNSDFFLGWEHQLRNEVAFTILYERKLKALEPRWHWGSWQSDLIWHYGGALGTLATYVNAGAEVRLGRSLPDDFASSPLRLAGNNTSPAPSHAPLTRHRHWHLFASLDARAVARNLFLDGNTFLDSHRVSREVLVGDLTLGAAAFFGKGWRIAFSLTAQTKTFETQSDAHNFGSLSLSKTID